MTVRIPLTTCLRNLMTSAALSVLAAGPALGRTTSTGDDSEALTFRGITLYGTVDLGIQYETRGAPISDSFSGGGNEIIEKNGNRSIWGVTPSNLGQSRVGLSGIEAVSSEWSAVLKLETWFNPQSGELSDALKAITQNNGRALAAQTTNLDSSVAGQIFQQAFGGFTSSALGTFAFGRQNTLLADGIAKYDPNAVSQAFSVLGASGVAAGGGDTEDRRLDSTIKYTNHFGQKIRIGLFYRFSSAVVASNSAFGAN